MELLGTWEPDWPFRTHWEYQNLCYVALGLVIESVSGMAWEEFIKKEFLEPLCMKQTGFFLEELAEYPNHAEPYGRPQADRNRGMISVPWFLFPKENKKSGTHAPHGPAGSIYSNVNDMEKWLNFQLGLYPERAQTILKKEFLAEMHRPQMQMENSLYLKCPEQTEFSYGYGWFRSKYRGITLLDHGGNVPGYGCLAVLVPELKLGITAHINLCDTTFAYALAYEIIDHELGISGGDWFARQWNYMENRNQKEEIRNGSETM